ncbi:MAG: site-2 protease family protein [Christensenellales bacterium]|jgi:Zn-dependent protease
MIYYILMQDNPRDIFLCAVAVLGAIMVAFMVHEYAHGYVAKLNGDPTAEYSGRLTFNPIKHFDIFGLIMFMLAGFGWAKPVPVNPNNYRNLRRGNFTVAIAGISANLIVALLSGGLIALLGALVSDMNLSLGSVAYILLFLISQFLIVSLILNVALIVFNMLPIFPLDGFRVVEAFAKPGNAYVNFMYRNGIYVFFGLIILGRILGQFNPYLDPLGLYLSFINNLLLNTIAKIFGI